MTTKRITRTQQRSISGKKLLTVRDRGKYRDVQQWKRSSRADQRRTTVAEAERRVVAATMKWRRLDSRDRQLTGAEVQAICVAFDDMQIAADKLAEARKAARRKS